MIKVNPSKIFNANKRTYEETPTYKCFYTFNYKGDQNETDESFGELKFLNDESLSPREAITYTQEEDTRIVLLPIAGALNYRNNTSKEELVKSEQIKILDIKKGLPYTFTNPFEKEWINYLHIGFTINHPSFKHSSTVQNIQLTKINELVCFDHHRQPVGYIGMYQGRREERFTLKNAGHGVFIYVINGAFEVQGRLLEYRDGLSLWDMNEIGFEALSNNAMIMLLEIKLK